MYLKERRKSQPSSLPSFVGPQISVLIASLTLGGILAGKRRSRMDRARTRVARVGEDPRVTKALESTQRALLDARERVDVHDAQLLLDELAHRAGVIAQATRAELPPRTREVTEKAMEVLGRLRDEGATLSSDVGDKIRSDVAPVARSWAQEAIDEAEQILAIAREKAGELSESARTEYVPKVSSTAGSASGLVAGTAVTAAHAIGKRLGDKGRTSPVAGVKHSVESATKTTGGAVRRAGDQTKYVLGETSGILFWTGVLGAVVYFGLLTAERRARIRGFFSSVFGQVQDLFSEYSSEEEFPRPSDA